MNELSQFLNPGLLSCIGQFCCFLFLKPIPTQPHQKESWKGLLTLKTSLFSEFFFFFSQSRLSGEMEEKEQVGKNGDTVYPLEC